MKPYWLFRLLLASALIVVTHLATTELEYALISDLHDKLQHLLAFLALALLLDLSFPTTNWGWKKLLPLLCYGLLLEVIQSQLPYRDFSLGDLAADILGLLLYPLFASLLRKTPLRRFLAR